MKIDEMSSRFFTEIFRRIKGELVAYKGGYITGPEAVGNISMLVENSADIVKAFSDTEEVREDIASRLSEADFFDLGDCECVGDLKCGHCYDPGEEDEEDDL